jgi:chaperonin cofactor prefoldin
MKKCKILNEKRINKYEKDIEELKKQINDLINNNCKMHYKTLQKINNNGNMNTGTINNTINIMALGQENIDEVLSKTDKIAILNKKENALPYMIEMVHFNDKYPQFKNIAITNNRTKQAYVYDTVGKVFKMVDKEELIEELIDIEYVILKIITCSIRTSWKYQLKIK